MQNLDEWLPLSILEGKFTACAVMAENVGRTCERTWLHGLKSWYQSIFKRLVRYDQIHLHVL